MKTSRVVAVVALSLVIFTGCKTLDRVVFIDYDQPTNFRDYQFAQNVLPPNSPYDWNLIEVTNVSKVTGEYDGTKRNVWLLYQICSVRNDASNARPFQYDISKFYVAYKNNKFFASPLSPSMYQKPFDHIPGSPQFNPTIAKTFDIETRQGPKQQTIDPHTSDTLSIAWRFVVYLSIDGNDKDFDDLLTAAFPLRYDRDGVDMVSRGYDPVFAGGDSPDSPIKAANLPLTCRPPQ